jgi:hypothetical protein
MTQPTVAQVVPGETVYASVLFQPSSGVERLEMLVTDKAVSFGHTFFVGGWRIVRVEHGDVKAVELKRVSSIGAIVGGIFLFLVGAAATLGVWANGDAIEGGMRIKHVVVPLMLTVGGLAMPFIARGRRRLELTYAAGKFRWKPPLMFFKANRVEADRAMATCAEALGRAGHQVIQ